MRSHALAYLLRARGGFDVAVLEGGYKAFRSWARLVFCHVEPNASYSFREARPQGAKRKRGSQRAINRAKKKAEKMARRGRAPLQGDGAERRRAAMAARAAREERDAAEAAERARAETRRAEAEWSATFREGPSIVIVGGRTGSGKTKVLRALAGLGQQTLDLEGLARHNGSAFGFVGHREQPTNQQFGNEVAVAWARLDPSRPVFVEDEGPNVGRVSTPVGLYRLMRGARTVVRLVVPDAVRVGVLLEDYVGAAEKDPGTGAVSARWRRRMADAARSLEKRVGPQRTRRLLECLEGSDFAEFARTALTYYDGLYDKHIRSAEGSGRGAGVRAAAAVDVRVEEGGADGALDAGEVARQVLAAVARPAVARPAAEARE
jgi:energy-coupling factor transporter ATP-binding protein EcfA2